jgi:hypothetical protein
MSELTYTPFVEIIVKNNPLGGTLITWALRQDFCEAAPYTFRLYWCESPNGKRTEVNTPVLINTYFAIDTEQRTWALDIESYYVITLKTAQGTYESYPAHANAFWKKRDWLIAREICRKEYLLCRKFTGWEGWLVKRMIWGPKCPRCADIDTQDARDGHCLACYGTGKEGGYWPRYPSFVYNMQSGPSQFKQLNDNAGLTEDAVMTNMRILGYPHLATNDVLILEGSGRRFFVRPVKIEAEIKGIPLVYTCELRLAPATDIIYRFPYQPEPPPPPPVPPTPESEPTYTQPEPLPPMSIKWLDGEWRLGTLYRTNSGYPMPDGLDTFTWTHADGSAASLVITEAGGGYTVAGDNVVAGNYQPKGLASGLTIFERVIA